MGAKSAAPTVDNDGNPLVAGALYFNNGTVTVDDKGMWVYDGGTWIKASAAQQAALVTYEFVATSGQTTFSGNDANGLALTYIAGGVIVALNGVVLRPGDDYTATNGSSIVLASAAALNDELQAFAFASFNIANTYTQAQTDALLATKQAADAELTTLAGMSASRATYLASTEGFGFRNRIINGDMRIDQRNNGASVTSSAGAAYTLDRWGAWGGVASKYTVQRNAGGVTPPTGFTNYLGVTSTSAYTPASSEFFTIYQPIEGFNTADFNWGTSAAVAATVSFWVRSSITGTHSGNVISFGNTASYVFTFTVNTANTWEYKTITIPGPTVGTWNTNNSGGVQLGFNLGSGSSVSTSAGSWSTAANFWGATGAVSVVGTNGATFYITGVQLEAGSVATPFERRDYGREVALCERYCQICEGGYYGPALNGAANAGKIIFRTTMRASATVTWLTNIRSYANGVGGWTVGAPVGFYMTSDGTKYAHPFKSATATGQDAEYWDRYLLSAEL